MLCPKTTICRIAELGIRSFSFSAPAATASEVLAPRLGLIPLPRTATLSSLRKTQLCKRSIGLKNQLRHHNLGTASYEGDGKTTVTILNHEIDSPLMVDSYNEKGFRLNNGMAVVGPIAIFPATVLAWDVGSVADIDEESLSLFITLEPKLDILVIGTGETGKTLSPSIIRYLRERKISVEALPTEYACQTFNFLNCERRCVAAALIPPGITSRGFFDEELKEKIRRRKLYEQD